MSKPSAKRATGAWVHSAVGGALALTLAACGSSTPRQADVEPPRETVAPAAARTSAVDADRDVRGRATQARAGMLEVEQRREQLPARAGMPEVEQPGAIAESPVPERRRDRRGERRSAETSETAGIDEPVPEAAAAAYARALAALRAENWLEAELELEQLVLEQPAYPGPHINLALVYLHDERRGDARAALERALSVAPGHAAANTQLGILLREDGKFAEAEAAYRRALATEPNHALAHYNLGVLLDLYLRRTAEALEHYEAYQATLAEPNETVARWIIDLRRRVGNGDAARVAQEDGP